eukprot:gene2160-1329_t
MCDEVLEEIVQGPCSETCGCSQCTWNDTNACYHCWKCAPCCGGPDCLGAACCALHWTLLCCGAHCKLYATSLHQRCSWWPHIYLGIYCCPCMSWMTRYNLRLLAGVPGNLCGDCCCMMWCCPCAFCQLLRSVQPEAWRLECGFPDISVSHAYYFLDEREKCPLAPDDTLARKTFVMYVSLLIKEELVCGLSPLVFYAGAVQQQRTHHLEEQQRQSTGTSRTSRQLQKTSKQEIEGISEGSVSVSVSVSVSLSLSQSISISSYA